jgi:hypothetical protein
MGADEEWLGPDVHLMLFRAYAAEDDHNAEVFLVESAASVAGSQKKP